MRTLGEEKPNQRHIPIKEIVEKECKRWEEEEKKVDIGLQEAISHIMLNSDVENRTLFNTLSSNESDSKEIDTLFNTLTNTNSFLLSSSNTKENYEQLIRENGLEQGCIEYIVKANLGNPEKVNLLQILHKEVCNGVDFSSFLKEYGVEIEGVVWK